MLNGAAKQACKRLKLSWERERERERWRRDCRLTFSS
jgi:hypothetical protein